RHADLFLAGTGVHHRQAVGEQPHDGHRDGLVGTGHAHVVVAFGDRGRGQPAGAPLAGGWPPARGRLMSGNAAHAITPGVSTPGCSKNTCTGSHSTWYVVTCTSLTTRGSSELAASTWSTAGLVPIGPWPPVSAMVSRPIRLAASRPCSTLGLVESA